MTKYIFLAAGGALGTLLRYSVSGLTYKYLNGSFPWGTLAVNLLGSFLIGFLWGFFEMQSMSSNMRSFVFIGMLGGFTTFSTFAFENFNLFRDGEIRIAVYNLLASNIFGVILVFAGFLISKYIYNLIRMGH